MRDQTDPIENALQSVRGLKWPGDYENNELENRLMQRFQEDSPRFRIGRRGAIAAALAVVLVGSVGFGAAGGVDAFKGWFFTIEVNGEAIDIAEADVTIEVDGEVVDIDAAEGSIEGDTVTMTLDNLQLDGEAGEEGTAEITIIRNGEFPGAGTGFYGDSTFITVELEAALPEDDEAADDAESADDEPVEEE